jgi:hypothetical protein
MRSLPLNAIVLLLLVEIVNHYFDIYIVVETRILC